ncbi:MAG TPA: prolipoprotein diacylglyceryl transferase family protein [Actinomycetota bacterium]|nr:prolipoprotein diacylglyceryl transferase family protein [Actinomycetota bacterium]
MLDRLIKTGDIGLVSPHGLGIAFGFLAGAYIFLHEARKRGIPDEQASAVPFWALIGTLVGTRLGYVLTHLSEFENPIEVLYVWRGGISLLGGIVGAVVFCYPVLRRRGVKFLVAFDSASIGIPMGIIIGRIGDLIIGDHLGKPTSWLLAFVYRGGSLSGYSCAAGECTTRLAEEKTQIITSQGANLIASDGTVIASGSGVHQTALYDLCATILLVLLLLFLNLRPRRMGILTLTFAAWYGIGRIVTDLLRVENRFFGLTGSQWTSVVVVVLSVATLVWFALRPEPGAVAAAASEEPEAERTDSAPV